MCLSSCSFVSKDFDTSDKDSLVIQLITYVLDQAHYLDKEIDDNFSEKVFNTFLENLDPYKRYFYVSDIEEFSEYKYSIDDAFKNPNFDFFDLVYERYKKRMSESEKIFNKILSTPFDFSKDEVCECDLKFWIMFKLIMNYMIGGENFSKFTLLRIIIMKLRMI